MPGKIKRVYIVIAHTKWGMDVFDTAFNTHEEASEVAEDWYRKMLLSFGYSEGEITSALEEGDFDLDPETYYQVEGITLPAKYTHVF